MFFIFNVKFYGTRGSTPVSGPQSVRYGGNTTCIALQAGEQLLVVDCGSGMLPLQERFLGPNGCTSAHIFLSHWHWDHIQGIAFFSPLFSPRYHFDWYSESRYSMTLSDLIASIMNSPVFPVKMDAFNSAMQYHEIHCGDTLTAGDVQVETSRLKHPNICTGYRFTYQGRSVCIVGDYEHGEDEPVLAFAKGTDLLIYDAQYTDEEYPAKIGWGHSTWQKGCAFAAACGAGRLALTHHDPSRSDEALFGLQRLADKAFPGAQFAWDGMELDV